MACDLALPVNTSARILRHDGPDCFVVRTQIPPGRGRPRRYGGAGRHFVLQQLQPNSPWFPGSTRLALYIVGVTDRGVGSEGRMNAYVILGSAVVGLLGGVTGAGGGALMAPM